MKLWRDDLKPRLSVMVPVRNEAAHIRRTLDGLTQQRGASDDVEILVVDGCSDDGTPAIVEEYQRTHDNIFLFHNPKRLSSAARNIAIEQSRGDFIVLVDGHCEIHNHDYLANILDAFDHSGADSLGRPQPLKAGELTTFQQAVSAARMSWLGHNPDSAIFDDDPRFVEADNVAVAYRKEVFNKIGLFDESFDACEDVEFNTRLREAGFTCYFTPSISVDYQPRRSWKALAFQMQRYGKGRARLARKNPKSVTLPSLGPPMMMLCFTFGAILAPLWWPFLVLWLTAISGYTALVLAESARLAIKQPTGAYWLPFVFPAIHFGFAWGYLKELIFGHPLQPVRMLPTVIPEPATAERSIAA